jgi:hypothetical protein
MHQNGGISIEMPPFFHGDWVIFPLPLTEMKNRRNQDEV